MGNETSTPKSTKPKSRVEGAFCAAATNDLELLSFSGIKEGEENKDYLKTLSASYATEPEKCVEEVIQHLRAFLDKEYELVQTTLKYIIKFRTSNMIVTGGLWKEVCLNFPDATKEDFDELDRKRDTIIPNEEIESMAILLYKDQLKIRVIIELLDSKNLKEAWKFYEETYLSKEAYFLCKAIAAAPWIIEQKIIITHMLMVVDVTKLSL